MSTAKLREEIKRAVLLHVFVERPISLYFEFQSDSDNSLSSIEVPSHSIAIPKKEEKKQCLWSNCGATFGSLSELASHVSQCHSSGGPDGLFHCGWEGCTRNNKGFNARYKMLVHVRTHTNEKPHRCFQCDKSFSRAENLKIHSRSHSGEKPYVCPVAGCSKAYSNSSDRFKHTRTHSVEKPYQCKVTGCPKRYTDPSSLRKHVKTYKHYPSEEAVDSPCVNNVSGMESAVFSVQIDIKEQRFGFGERTKLYRPYELDAEMPLDLSTRRSL